MAINVQIERDGQPLTASHHRMSLHRWQSLRRYSQEFLEKHEQFLEPGLVHYVFHSLSHRTANVPLQHGDWLSIDCPELELAMSNQIVEEELVSLVPYPHDARLSMVVSTGPCPCRKSSDPQTYGTNPGHFVKGPDYVD
ncbi:hypothetical protein THH46_12470 [Pseudomonas sp. NA13]